MYVYHEINPAALSDVLANGLKCTSRGDKGNDAAIIQTDKFLDAKRPESLHARGISRDNNLYGYMYHNGAVIDIRNGHHIPIKTFITQSHEAVLELKVDPQQCFVSDLDSFDALKTALQEGQDSSVLHRLASDYWRKLLSLKEYKIGMICRPEVMITYDVAPSAIRSLQ